MSEQVMSGAAESQAIGVKDLLFKNRNFRTLWLGQILSIFGDSVTMLTLMILVNELTGSTTALATMAIAQAIPRLLFGLVAGVYVDRLDRKKTMIVSDILRGVLVLGFILVDSPELMWLLYVIAFLHATVSTFFMPARSALIPNIVPKEGLLGANSIAQTSMILFGLLGTGAAGVILGVVDVYWPSFAIDSLTFFLSALMISRIVAPSRSAAADEGGSVTVILRQLGQGLKIVFGTRVLVGALVGMGVTMLGLGAVNILLVPMVINDLQVPETWFAALELAQTSSMILSGALIAVLAARFKPPQIISGGLIGIGIVVGLLSIVGNVWHLIFVLFAVGWFITPLQASLATLFQIAVSDEMRGRASSALNTVAQVANVVSMGAAGLLADAIGVRNVFVTGGVLVVVAGLAAAVVFRGYDEQIRRLQVGSTSPVPEAAAAVLD